MVRKLFFRFFQNSFLKLFLSSLDSNAPLTCNTSIRTETCLTWTREFKVKKLITRVVVFFSFEWQTVMIGVLKNEIEISTKKKMREGRIIGLYGRVYWPTCCKQEAFLSIFWERRLLNLNKSHIVQPMAIKESSALLTQNTKQKNLPS